MSIDIEPIKALRNVVGKTPRQQTLKTEIGALENRRKVLLAELGQRVFDTRKKDPNLLRDTKVLFTTLESIEKQLTTAESDLKALSEANESPAESLTRCQKCEGFMSQGQLFCTR